MLGTSMTDPNSGRGEQKFWSTMGNRRHADAQPAPDVVKQQGVVGRLLVEEASSVSEVPLLCLDGAWKDS